MSPKGILNVDLSYWPKCTIFLKQFQKYTLVPEVFLEFFLRERDFSTRCRRFVTRSL